MCTVTDEDQGFDFEALFGSMDKDLTSAIQAMVQRDQEVFDTYRIAHAEKYGEGFTAG